MSSLFKILPPPALWGKLFLGGVIGLAVWEIWARFITKAIVGYPLEPAGLLDALFQHNFGIAIPVLLREALHYAIGIIGYPVLYYIISRNIKNWPKILDMITAVSFTIAVTAQIIAGRFSLGLGLFWLSVVALIGACFLMRCKAYDCALSRIRNSIAWGSFTWVVALGIMAPLAGISFFLLNDIPLLSFMSFVGHAIYGAIAAYLFETWVGGKNLGQ